MSDYLSIIEARERLHARLWAGECALDCDSRRAIAGHRLWCALREQRFNAQEEGRRLSAHDLTEIVRRRLFSTAELTVDAEGFTAWITGMVPLTRPPSTPFITAVEAAWFLVRGAFLTADDITAITVAQIEIAGSVQTVGAPRNTLWELAEWRLFGAHVSDALTLLGRKAPRFGADPVGDLVPIPREFFAGKVQLGLFNGIYDRDHPDRDIYEEVAVSTDEFSRTFLTPGKPVISTDKIAPVTTRQPTKTDEREFSMMARDLYKTRGFGPSIKEARAFARERRLNRDWARDRCRGLPPELRRPRGGKGSTKYLAKPRVAE